MATIILKAKVKLPSEEIIELEDKDMGDVQWKKDIEPIWAWRKMGIDANDIARVINHSPDICMIEEYGGRITMIKEPFRVVYKKWTENITIQEVDFQLDNSEEAVPEDDEEE